MGALAPVQNPLLPLPCGLFPHLLKMAKNSKHIFKPATLALFAFLAFYVGYRAFSLSFTHDESLSYTILTGNTYWLHTANHHLLNSFLMGVFHKLLGNGEFALRLPNVLAFGVYLLVTGLLLFKKPTWAMLPGIAILLLNPFVLDFFSLARGYGLSFGFVMLSLYFFVRSAPAQLPLSRWLTDFSLAMASASLALFANLATINFFIALLLLFLVQYSLTYCGNRSRGWRGHLLTALVSVAACVPLGFALKRLLLLKDYGQLYFGVENLGGTLRSLVEDSLYFSMLPLWTIILIKILVLTSLVAAVVVAAFWRKRSPQLLKLTTLLLLIFIGLLIEHYGFGALYPSGRSALFLLPIYGLLIFYLLKDLLKMWKNSVFQVSLKIICSAILLAALVHFGLNANFERCKTWSYDAHTREAMLLVETRAGGLAKKAVISNDWLFEPAINYYIHSRQMNLQPTHRNPLNCEADFIYTTGGGCPGEAWEEVAHFERTETTLWQRK